MSHLQSIGRHIDVTNPDELAALSEGLEISREALHAVVQALGPVADTVRFFAMS